MVTNLCRRPQICDPSAAASPALAGANVLGMHSQPRPGRTIFFLAHGGQPDVAHTPEELRKDESVPWQSVEAYASMHFGSRK